MTLLGLAKIWTVCHQAVTLEDRVHVTKGPYFLINAVGKETMAKMLKNISPVYMHDSCRSKYVQTGNGKFVYQELGTYASDRRSWKYSPVKK